MSRAEVESRGLYGSGRTDETGLRSVRPLLPHRHRAALPPCNDERRRRFPLARAAYDADIDANACALFLPSMLTRIELHRYNQAVLAVHATPSLAQLPGNLLHVLRLVVSGDIAVVDWRGVEAMAEATAYDPRGSIPAEINAAVHRYLHQNPLYLQRRGAPRSISDVLSRQAWHRTELYAEAYGRLGQEDGLALDVPLARDGVLTLNMTRARRGFRDAERIGLRLIEPHVQACWQRLRAQERLRAAVAAHGDAATERLTAREREVLLWIANGLRNQQIAAQLGIRPATVKRHLENLYAKLGVAGRADARALLERAATPVLER